MLPPPLVIHGQGGVGAHTMVSARLEAPSSSGRPAGPPLAPRSLSRPYQGNPTFDPEFVRSKSVAAAGLCSWCINIVRFYEVYCDVAPKRQALEEANAELAEAQEKLSRIKNKIAVSAGGTGGRARGPGTPRAAPHPPNAPASGHPAPGWTFSVLLLFPGAQCQPEQPNVSV